MYACFGLGLFPQPGCIIPAIVKKNEQGFDVMSGRDGQVGIQSFLKSLFICRPQQVMQVNPHYIEPKIFSPAKFAVNSGGIKRFRLEHFQLVNGSGRLEITSPQPPLLSVPFVCLRSRPSFVLRCGHSNKKQATGH
jgi:hypothetical protein